MTEFTTRPFHHGWTAVGVTKVKAVGKTLPDGNFSGVLFKAPGNSDDVPNTVPVYIGGANVTANQNAANGGFPLAPGESLTLPLRYVEDLYVIATSSSQAVAWFLV